MAEAQEKEKKYNGPVGRDPWSRLAEDWSTGPKKNDYADELLMFKQRRIRERGSFETTKVVRDWDAPAEDPIVAALHQRQHREPSPVAEAVFESEEDSDEYWGKRLKKPRMAMRADEVKPKKPAKNRLFEGLKRRVKNDIKYEVYEDDEEPEEELDEPMDRGVDLRMTIQNRRAGNESNEASMKNMNERFPSNVRSRQRKISGDSLELDTGI